MQEGFIPPATSHSFQRAVRGIKGAALFFDYFYWAVSPERTGNTARKTNGSARDEALAFYACAPPRLAFCLCASAPCLLPVRLRARGGTRPSHPSLQQCSQTICLPGSLCSGME